MVDFQVQRYDFLPFPQNLLPKMDFPANFFFKYGSFSIIFSFMKKENAFWKRGFSDFVVFSHIMNNTLIPSLRKKVAVLIKNSLYSYCIQQFFTFFMRINIENQK